MNTDSSTPDGISTYTTKLAVQISPARNQVPFHKIAPGSFFLYRDALYQRRQAGAHYLAQRISDGEHPGFDVHDLVTPIASVSIHYTL